MQNITSGEYLVAIGVELFKRYPVDERTTENNTEISIEWQHGRYLGKSILDIDMYSSIAYQHTNHLNNLLQLHLILLQHIYSS